MSNNNPNAPTIPPGVPVGPHAFLQVLEHHRGDHEAALRAIGVDPQPVYEHRDADAQFREQWERIVHSFTDEAQESFLRAYQRTHKVVLACREAGIPRETLYRMRQADSFFQDEWRKIEDAWEKKLGQPGGHPDRNTDADIEVIRYRLPGKVLPQVIDIYRKVLSWKDENIPRSVLNAKLGIPPTSIQKDYDVRAPRAGRKGAQSKGERVEFSREYVIEFVVYRHSPNKAKRVSRKKRRT